LRVTSGCKFVIRPNARTSVEWLHPRLRSRLGRGRLRFLPTAAHVSNRARPCRHLVGISVCCALHRSRFPARRLALSREGVDHFNRGFSTVKGLRAARPFHASIIAVEPSFGSASETRVSNQCTDPAQDAVPNSLAAMTCALAALRTHARIVVFPHRAV